MSVLFVLVPAALAIVLVAVLAFVWAARRGQFDDLTTPAMRALHDDDPERARAARPDPPRAISDPKPGAGR
jgi:cbb3-type cytochrome oxidase maturation protein